VKKCLKRSLITAVSIPHRYGKNLMKNVLPPTKTGVSIPHRYGKNIEKIEIFDTDRKVSIPHRYGKNPKTR